MVTMSARHHGNRMEQFEAVYRGGMCSWQMVQYAGSTTVILGCEWEEVSLERYIGIQ